LAQACATITEFLTVTGSDFLYTGPKSTGTVTVAVQPAPGDTFTIVNPHASPPVAEVYTAGTDFAIGGTVDITATNLAGALAGSALVDAYALSGVVTMTSKTTGPGSMLPMASSDPASLVLSASTLEGGDATVQFALECACSQINLCRWGVKASCGHIYLTGHFLSVQSGAGGGEGGAVSSKKIDKISIGYATPTFDSSDAALASTKWGRMYLALRDTIFVTPVVGTGLPRVWPGSYWGRGRGRW